MARRHEGLRAGFSTHRAFEPKLIQPLFQTEDYARALLIGGGSPKVEEDVAERMARQSILDRAFVTAVLDEEVLRRPIGSPAIMRDQLSHVLKVAERDNVLVHVIPATFDTGAYPGLDGALTLLTGDDFGEVAYTESLGGGRLISSPREVAEFAILFTRIMGAVLPAGQSVALIRRVMEEAFQSDDDVAEE
ncbi:DUF5753 domain-containing protein [Actinomadura sp. NBRC 104412]|uniref:DUF5753 domain-containing protein n=1 Tax=Actinomadura sp. NBRC 104412 TaxID=3032203 RepID=UPI002557139F|nr:DUF5753 domain-containing protein [Actinomadura sp. NBRC 104412]